MSMKHVEIAHNTFGPIIEKLNVENYKLKEENKKIKESILDIIDILKNVPELNMSNYTHEEVRKLNDATNEIFQICDGI